MTYFRSALAGAVLLLATLPVSAADDNANPPSMWSRVTDRARSFFSPPVRTQRPPSAKMDKPRSQATGVQRASYEAPADEAPGSGKNAGTKAGSNEASGAANARGPAQKNAPQKKIPPKPKSLFGGSAPKRPRTVSEYSAEERP